MNYTWPGRFHLIVHRNLVYVTLWFWGRRYHASAHRLMSGSQNQAVD